MKQPHGPHLPRRENEAAVSEVSNSGFKNGLNASVDAVVKLAADDTSPRVYRGPSGEISLWFPASDVAACRILGNVSGLMARQAYDECDRHNEEFGHFAEGFNDFSGVDTYDWEARMVMVRWKVQHRTYLRRVHYLVSSPSVEMGVRLLKVALGELVVAHRDSATYEAAYHEALALRQLARANNF
jgi:hypothetical protein